MPFTSLTWRFSNCANPYRLTLMWAHVFSRKGDSIWVFGFCPRYAGCCYVWVSLVHDSDTPAGMLDFDLPCSSLSTILSISCWHCLFLFSSTWFFSCYFCWLAFWTSIYASWNHDVSKKEDYGKCRFFCFNTSMLKSYYVLVLHYMSSAVRVEWEQTTQFLRIQ